LAFGYTYVFVAFGAALATIAVVLATAPSLRAGTTRLRRIARAVCSAVISAGYATGAVTLVWGFVAHDAGMIYFALAAFVVAILTSNFLSRSAF
jgi:hypothetical protein